MAVELNRIVPFLQVEFEPTDWNVAGPDAQGNYLYTATNGGSSVTITRADGKVLDWDPPRGTHIKIHEDVVMFHADEGALPFK